MDVGQTIFEAITHALTSEELRLKARSERELWPWTVRGGYNENWVRYLLVRELSERLPELDLAIEIESGGVPQVDLLIQGHATVELKGPHLVKKNFYKPIRDKILEDFEKQKRRAERDPNLKHFVLLILHAEKPQFDAGFVQGWLNELESDVRKQYPGIVFRLHPSEPIHLNGKPWLLQCCLYSVL